MGTERYARRNWHDFDYISVEPTGTQWMIFMFFLFATQIGLYIFFHANEHGKEFAA